MGLTVGARSDERVPVIEGLPVPRSEDQLKALGVAAASFGSVALFHAVGITPEAPTLADALGDGEPDETITINPAAISRALGQLSSVPDGSPITAVCLGTPHFSRDEWNRLLPLLRQTKPGGVPIYVNTARSTLKALDDERALSDVNGWRVIVVTDTCTYLTPILERLDGVVIGDERRCRACRSLQVQRIGTSYGCRWRSCVTSVAPSTSACASSMRSKGSA